MGRDTANSSGSAARGNSHVFQGIVYAPRGVVQFSGNKATIKPGAIVAESVKFNGNEHVVDKTGLVDQLPPPDNEAVLVD